MNEYRVYILLKSNRLISDFNNFIKYAKLNLITEYIICLRFTKPVTIRALLIIITTTNRFMMPLQIYPPRDSLTLSWYKVMRIVSRRLADDVKLDYARWSSTCTYDAFIGIFSLHNNINLCHMIISDKCYYVLQQRHKIVFLSINSKVINFEISLLRTVSR